MPEKPNESNASDQTQKEALRAEFWRLPDEALVDRETTGAVFYLSTSSLEAMAVRGGGTKYTRIGRRALYRKADLLAWAAENGRTVEHAGQLHQARTAQPVTA